MKTAKIADEMGLIRVSIVRDCVHGIKAVLGQLSIDKLMPDQIGQKLGRCAGRGAKRSLKLPLAETDRGSYVPCPNAPAPKER